MWPGFWLPPSDSVPVLLRRGNPPPAIKIYFSVFHTDLTLPSGKTARLYPFGTVRLFFCTCPEPPGNQTGASVFDSCLIRRNTVRYITSTKATNTSVDRVVPLMQQVS